jgi:DMSO/TMAO reductase YedYZ molybdopterin-dependent catalytic subunit
MTQVADRSAPAAEPRPKPSRAAQGWAWLAGVVSGLAGLAIADLSAWLVAPAGSPVPAVGTAIINLLPAALVNWGKETLGTADKPFLLAVIALGVLALSGLAGRIELARQYAGALIFAAVAVIGGLAVLTGAQAADRALLPTIVGLVLGYLILNLLIARLRRWQAREGRNHEAEATVQARRAFLGWTIGVGVAAAIGAVAGRALTAAAGAVADARSRLQLPAPVTTEIVPAGTDLHVPDLSPYLTPNDKFYRIDTALQTPQLDANAWSLTIGGMVDREVTLNYADLLAKPLVEHAVTLTCVSNDVGGDLVGNARWLGYPIHLLLAEAGPHPDADMVLSTSDDGWTAGTPLSALTDPHRLALLAVGMNGEPLPIDHGFPVRMVVPGLYGYVSATKWVREMKVTTYAKDTGYWTPLGWSAMGPIKIGSRIDVPRKRSVSAGRVVLAGVAWAQHTGISKVEVGIDGVWRPVGLAEVISPDTWRQWSYAWDASPGSHIVAVRATDSGGRTQTSAAAPPAPDGATGWHTVTIKVG